MILVLMQDATVFVSVYGNDDTRDTVNGLLRRHRAEVQRLIARNCKLKYTPKITFRFDERTEQADRVLQLLDQLATDENKPQAE